MLPWDEVSSASNREESDQERMERHCSKQQGVMGTEQVHWSQHEKEENRRALEDDKNLEKKQREL